MSAVCTWTGGRFPLNVEVIRREGPDLLPGEWEARVVTTGAKVLVRENELEPLVRINVKLEAS